VVVVVVVVMVMVVVVMFLIKPFMIEVERPCQAYDLHGNLFGCGCCQQLEVFSHVEGNLSCQAFYFTHVTYVISMHQLL